MKIFFKTLIFKISNFLNLISSPFIKKDAVLFYGTNYKYIDNPRYLFECASKTKSNLNFIWVSYDKNISKYLKKKNYNYTNINSILYFYYILKTKIIICSGMNIPPIFKDRYDVKKINLWHGYGPRSLNSFLYKNENEDAIFNGTEKNLLKQIQAWNYFVFSSKFIKEKLGKNIFGLKENQCLVYGMSRVENFFKKNSINYINKIYYKNYNKVILYAPTWRKKISQQQPLMKLIKNNIKKFDSFLNKKNYLFLYSGHHYEGNKDFKNVHNIKSYRNQKFTDINQILQNTDVLITDISSIITNYALLKKKIIFYIPDKMLLKKEIDFYDDFINDLPGKEIKTYNELKTELKNKKNYKSKNFIFSKYLKKYYDVKLTEPNKKLFKLINQI